MPTIKPIDDSIGTGEVPPSMQSSAPPPKLTLGRGKSEISQESKTSDELYTNLWLTSMVYESGVMREAFEKKFFAIDCDDQAGIHRIRMRLYRCKRLLLRQGNVYVGALTFEARDGRYLIVKVSENIHKRKVVDPAILRSLGLNPDEGQT